MAGFSGLQIGWPKQSCDLPVTKDGSNLKELMYITHIQLQIL